MVLLLFVVRRKEKRSLEAVQALEGESEGSAASAVLVDDNSAACLTC